jgi:hypothetical protein
VGAGRAALAAGNGWRRFRFTFQLCVSGAPVFPSESIARTSKLALVKAS